MRVYFQRAQAEYAKSLRNSARVETRCVARNTFRQNALFRRFCWQFRVVGNLRVGVGCFNQHAGRVARTGQLPVRTDPPRVAEQPVPAREALAAAVTAVGVDARLAAPAAFDYGVKLARRRGWRVESDPREACEHHAQLSISSIVGMTVFGVLAGRQSEMTRPHCRHTNWRHVGEITQFIAVLGGNLSARRRARRVLDTGRSRA